MGREWLIGFVWEMPGSSAPASPTGRKVKEKKIKNLSWFLFGFCTKLCDFPSLCRNVVFFFHPHLLSHSFVRVHVFPTGCGQDLNHANWNVGVIVWKQKPEAQ